MKIIADNKIPFLAGALEPYADIVYLPGRDITNAMVQDADALIIRTRTRCNEQLLRGTKVRFIATATIGYDHLDTAYCERNGIFWTNAPGCNSSSVQQYIASALVTLSEQKGFDLKNRSLGVIGVGNVGSKIVSLAEHLEMNVYLNDPPRERKEGSCQFISLEGIIRECDIISLHVPLNMDGIDKTYHMVDDAFLKKVTEGTIIINSSRGEVVNSAALKAALQSGPVSAAVLDVWENEPFIDTGLMHLAAIATPHIAGYSADGKANGTMMSVSALSKFFGLGVDDWVPSGIPEPSEKNIMVDCTGKNDDMIIQKAILSTYKVIEDDRRLRESASSFEEQRGSYPLRREFHAYQVILSEKRQEVQRKLKRLGFKVKINQ
ncbi:MAG: 4-phosphoerythronate dehydrogenase PdxB [Bacteroidales bacterium]|nr:4-phosphoerythronate dehydrogenase PdxB [Bacteroidales bacterium]